MFSARTLSRNPVMNLKYKRLTIETVAHPWCSKTCKSLCFKAQDFSCIVTARLKAEVCTYKRSLHLSGSVFWCVGGDKYIPLFKHWPTLSYEQTVKRETSLTGTWNLGHLIHISKAAPQHNKCNSSAMVWVRGELHKIR